MNIITDNTKLNANIKTIGKKRAELEQLIQDTGVGALFQAMANKNMNTSNDLCAAVKGGMRVEALVLWLCEFGPFKPGTKQDRLSNKFVAYDKERMPKDEADMNARLAAAMAKPWHAEDTENKAYKFLSVANEIHRLIALIEDPKDRIVVQGDGEVSNSAAADVLRELARKMPKVDIKKYAAEYVAEHAE